MTEVESKSPAPPSVVGDHPSAPEQANDANTESDGPHFAPQGPSGQPFPPPNFVFYNYPPGGQPPPPPSGEGGNPDSTAPNQPNGNGQGPPGPYPPPPPGMMFPYPYPQPPPGYMPVSMAGMPLPGALVKPKRKQVKMACTNCAAACKRCDVGRPCERCIKYGLTESCRDGVRKERKKGFKRGPYNKRKRQEEREAHEWEAQFSAAHHHNPNGEWPPGGPGGAPFPGPPQQGGFPPPEGYYPAFYALAPPPPGPGPQLVPVTQSSGNENAVGGQPDGNAASNNQSGEHGQAPQGQPAFPPPHAQFVYPPLPPGTYPPYGYPFQNPAQQQHPQQQQPQQPPPPQPQAEESAAQSNVSGTKRASPEDTKEDDEEDPPTPPRKRRGRRNSDGEWPGASRRTAKTKAENAGPTRRSTRKQQHHQADAAEEGGGQAQNEGSGIQAATSDSGVVEDHADGSQGAAEN